MSAMCVGVLFFLVPCLRYILGWGWIEMFIGRNKRATHANVSVRVYAEFESRGVCRASAMRVGVFFF